MICREFNVASTALGDDVALGMFCLEGMLLSEFFYRWNVRMGVRELYDTFKTMHLPMPGNSGEEPSRTFNLFKPRLTICSVFTSH